MTDPCKQLQEENRQLRTRNEALLKDYAELKNHVSDTDKRMIALEQYSRNKNIEVKNVYHLLQMKTCFKCLRCLEMR